MRSKNAPEAWGAAEDVPDAVVKAAFGEREVMDSPGASRSVFVFLSLKEERVSVFVLDATAIVFWMHAGERISVVLPLFPVAAMVVMLYSFAVVMSVERRSESQVVLWSQVVVNPPEHPRLMLMTEIL